MRESHFNKVAGLRRATLLKKRLWYRCLPVSFTKFLRRPFFIDHLWWLLLWIIYELSRIFEIIPTDRQVTCPKYWKPDLLLPANTCSKSIIRSLEQLRWALLWCLYCWLSKGICPQGCTDHLNYLNKSKKHISEIL